MKTRSTFFSLTVIMVMLASLVFQVTPALAFPARAITICPPGSATFTTGALNVPAGDGFTDVDVMFVVDTTGSMGGVIDSAKAGAIDIMNNVKGTFAGAQFGVAEFRDYPPEDSLPYLLHQTLTTSNTDVSNALNSLSADGGGDRPESAAAAFNAMLAMPWRGGTVGKFVVLFTDAPAQDPDIASGKSLDTILGEMNTADINLLAVISASDQIAYWDAKSALTGDKAAVIEYIESTFVGDVTDLILGAAGRTLGWSLSDPAYNSWVSSAPASHSVPNAGGAYTFDMTITVPGGTTGVHNFTVNYTVDGTIVDSEALTVTAQCNAAPVADNDSYSTPMGTLLNGTTVLDGDTDANGDPLTAALVAGPTHAASFAFNPDGTFTYTPANGFSGPDTFTYVANDGAVNSNTATVTINVINHAPTSLALSNRFIQEERPAGVIIGALSSTDTDLTDAVTYSLTSTTPCDGADNGYFAVNGTNLVTSGTPRIDFQTKYYLSICLRATDLGGLTFDQHFTIVVRSIHQFPMDTNGDGKDDYVTFRPNTGTWHLRLQPPIINFGQLGDLPVAADYNGDGKDDIAFFRPAATGTWNIYGQATVINFGTAGDVPLPLDYNGDGKDDIAVFRPSTATWHIRFQILSLAFGQIGDIPVPADYNGDKKADIAVFNPATGNWTIRGQAPIAFGKDGDIPVPADYNNDGKADIAVYRPSTGTWHIRNIGVVTFGGFYDLPFPMHLQNATTLNYVVIHTGAAAIDWQALGLPTITFGANDDVHQ